MRRTFSLLLLLCLALLALNSYGQDRENAAYAGDIGFTPWPYDLTEQAVNETYSFINENASMISHHFDGGVPWVEALEKEELPDHLQSEWAKRRANTDAHLKIFLSLTPLNFDRDALAPYWGDSSENLPLPKNWASKALDDMDVIDAYAYYALKAVEYFKPDYLAIGIEANIMITKNHKKWDAYLALNQAVYEIIKNKYPALPVFSTIQYEHYRGIEDAAKENHHLQNAAVKALMKHSDILGLSTYQYGFLHPNKIDDAYFDAALKFNKPIAIAEAGAMSKTTMVMGMPLLSSKKNQLQFWEMIFDHAQKHRFKFVINWVPIDFDPMLPKLPKNMREIAKAWVHTGMLTHKKIEKPAFKLWKKHLKAKSLVEKKQ